jgi:ABC-type transporter Mla maintaining outer membrane lipid asymmetry permease subunit MlaE
MIDAFSGIDLIFLLVKGLGAGCIIAVMNCLAGLSVRSSPLEVPPASANGTVASLFGVMIPYALLTALEFALK